MIWKVRDERKLIEIWLTNEEKDDPLVQAELKRFYAAGASRKYLVAVYQSGSCNLYENTLALLAYNKKRTAELDVQREKRRSAAAWEC